MDKESHITMKPAGFSLRSFASGNRRTGMPPSPPTQHEDERKKPTVPSLSPRAGVSTQTLDTASSTPSISKNDLCAENDMEQSSTIDKTAQHLQLLDNSVKGLSLRDRDDSGSNLKTGDINNAKGGDVESLKAEIRYLRDLVNCLRDDSSQWSEMKSLKQGNQRKLDYVDETEEKKETPLERKSSCVESNNGSVLECDFSGWSSSITESVSETQVPPSQPSKAATAAWGYLNRPKNLFLKRCPNCEVLEQTHRSEIKTFRSKLESRENIISTFEATSQIHSDALNGMRDEIDAKNKIIADLREELDLQSKKEKKWKLEFEKKNRVIEKLKKGALIDDKLLQSKTSATGSAQIGSEIDIDKKSLIEFIHLLKTQLESKDQQVKKIVSAFEERKKAISALAKDIVVIDRDLLSRVEDDCSSKVSYSSRSLSGRKGGSSTGSRIRSPVASKQSPSSLKSIAQRSPKSSKSDLSGSTNMSG